MDTQISWQELRAWRERLGKDEEWAEDVLRAADIEYLGRGDKRSGSERREWIENSRGHYSERQTEQLRTAYRAALEAEEARQAAERGPVEPVCPEGVTVRRESCYIYVDRAGHVRADGSVSVGGSTCADRVALRYLVDLADYRARKHAEGDRQRKLDAVKAAEVQYDAAVRVVNKARDACAVAERAKDVAHKEYVDARREAGLCL